MSTFEDITWFALHSKLPDSDMIPLNEMIENSELDIKNYIDLQISDIKKNVYHCKQQGGVLKRVYATIANVDNNLMLIFKKLADNSSKAKEIQYPIKRKHGKKF